MQWTSMSAPLRVTNLAAQAGVKQEEQGEAVALRLGGTQQPASRKAREGGEDTLANLGMLTLAMGETSNYGRWAG